MTMTFDEIQAVIEDGSITVDILNKFIQESLAKSAIERVHRRTRQPRSGPKGISMIGRVVPKKTGDSNPNKNRGSRNFRGSEKEKQDEWKRKHPEKFSEAIDFIINNNGKEISLESVNDKKALKDVIAKLLISDHKLSQDWLYKVYNSL